MPNVAEVIRDHVTLAVECVDRLYLNAYVPGLQRGPGVVAFLRQCLFRGKTNSRFGVSRTPISDEVVHRFRTKPNSRFG